jgi:hypothetical protein
MASILRYAAAVLPLLLTSLAVAGGTLSAGDPLDEAIALHISNAGLASVGDALEGLVPTHMDVTGLAGELACDEPDDQPLTYAMDDLRLTFTVQEAEILASDGHLDLTLYLTLGSEYAELSVDGDCSILQDLDETCGIELPTTAATLHIGMFLGLGPNGFSANVDDFTFWVSPIGNPLSDCTLSSAIGALLGQDGGFISGLIIGLVQPELEGLSTTIEEALADGLDALWISEEIDLLGTPLFVDIYPSDLRLDDTGMMIGVGMASWTAARSDCVPAGMGSPLGAPGWPQISATAWDGSLEYDAGLFVNRDGINHLLWNVWASGVLCLDVGEFTAKAGISSLDTDFLGGLYGESFSALFPEPVPASLRLGSSAPPTIVFDDDVPFIIDLADLGIETYAELSGRQARITKLSLPEPIGIDPGISSEALALSISLDLADLRFEESFNETIDPGFGDGLSDFIVGLLPTFLGSSDIDDLLPVIAIPTFQGAGLEAVFWQPDATGQWQGGFALLETDAVEPIELAGCSAAGFGCGGFSDTGGGGLDVEDLLAGPGLGCGGDTGDTGGAGACGGCAGCDTGGDAGCGGCGGCDDSGCACSAPGHRHYFWPGWRIGMFTGLLALVATRRRS